jgi:prepilin-type N-terminal cleavage/methylation domain-containing protein
MTRNKQAFTLLEMMIALTILVLIASFTGVHIKRLIDTHRFESQIGDLFTSLQEVQVLSAAYQTDFALEIKQEKGQFFYRFLTDEPLPEKKFSQKEVPLLAGTQVKFKEKNISHLVLDIYGGRIEPLGFLSFLQSKEEKAKGLYIDLRCGNLIKFSSTKPPIIKLQTSLQPLKEFL